MKQALCLMGACMAMIILAGCDQSGGDPAIIDTTPVFTDTSRVDLEIFTLDTITPEGGIELVVSDVSSPDTPLWISAMKQEPCELPDVSRWSGWVNVASLGSKTYLMRFRNAEGQYALGAGGVVDPWWRELDSYLLNMLEQLDPGKGIWFYSETVRNWENTNAGKIVRIEGTASFPTDYTALDSKLTVYAGHFVSEHNSYLEAIGGYTFNGESFEREVGPLNITVNEEDYTYSDEIHLQVKKNFYTPLWTPSINYSELIDTASYTARATLMAPNKVVSFRWAVSDTGTFTVEDIDHPGIINSVSRYDFLDWDLANYYFSTFNDGLLSSTLNEYWFDNNQQIGFRLNTRSDSDTTTLYLYCTGPSTGVLDISLAPESIQDLSSVTGWKGSVILTDAGQRLAIKSPAGYALIELDQIAAMTQGEMDSLLEDFEASVSSGILSGSHRTALALGAEEKIMYSPDSGNITRITSR